MELIVVALATWQAVEIWRHSELTADWLDGVDCWLGVAEEQKPVWRESWLSLPTNVAAYTYHTVKVFLSRLVLCPWCLSVWVGCIVGIAYRYGPEIAQIPLLGLAASRLANLGNDLFHRVCRTPRPLSVDDQQTGSGRMSLDNIFIDMLNEQLDSVNNYEDDDEDEDDDDEDEDDDEDDDEGEATKR